MCSIHTPVAIVEEMVGRKGRKSGWTKSEMSFSYEGRRVYRINRNTSSQ